jgi:hypothetical protein
LKNTDKSKKNSNKLYKTIFMHNLIFLASKYMI